MPLSRTDKTLRIPQLSNPARMNVSHIIDALDDTVEFEYQGETTRLFRGIVATPQGKAARRMFWVMRDNNWIRDNSDPYELATTTPAEGITSALRNGAEGIICHSAYKGHPALEGKNVFFSPNTLHFVTHLIAAQRRMLDRRMIAVTGSAGKSTTCAMIAHAMQGADSERTVQCNTRNRNRLAPVLTQQSRSHRYSNTVLEVAGSVFTYDHIDFSVSADVSIVTSISEAHLDYLDDLAGVARYKSEIFKRPPQLGLAVVNLDTPHADVLVERAVAEGSRLLTYGEHANADIRLVDHSPTNGSVRANVAGLEVEYFVGAPGKHMALNSLAVLATLRDLGLDWAAGMASLATFAPLSGRGEVVQVPLDRGGEVALVDGSFNANPASMRASLAELADTSPAGRRIAVLGDILELGDQSQDIHRSLVSSIRGAGIDDLHLVGEQFHHLSQSVTDLAGEVHRWQSADELVDGLPALLGHGDVVLIKGSNGTGLKRLSASLMRRVRPNE